MREESGQRIQQEQLRSGELKQDFNGLGVKTSWWVFFQTLNRRSNLQAGQPDFEIRAVSPTQDPDCSKLNHNKDKCNVLSCPWAIGIR